MSQDSSTLRPLAIFVLLALALFSTSAAIAADAPELTVNLDDMDGNAVREVYEEQSVQYKVTVENIDDVPPPKLVGFDDFDVVLAGKRSLGSRRFVLNGRVIEESHGGVQYVYQLTPRKLGLLALPSVTVEVDGRELVGPEMTLRVRPAEEQDVVFMKISSDREAVYPMQPFTVTLNVQIKSLPEPLGDESPLSRHTPLLNIPWALDENLPEGLEPSVDWQRWLGPMQNRKEGFSINNLGRGSIYSIFGSQPMTFLPRVGRVERPDAEGKPTEYWQYEFPRLFVAKKTGPLTFGPVTLNGVFGVRVGARDKLFGAPIYAVAPRLTIDVKDVPTEGRPDTFTGAIGQFSLEGRLEPDKVKVGDPMTLTLTLTGQGTLGSTFAPDLERVPEIASHFKVYDATEETEGNSSQFTYALRPLEEGTKKFPPVPLTYFDVESERFVTLKTDPVPITVTAADLLSSDQVVAAPDAEAIGRRELEARHGGIFANITDVASVRNEQVRPGRWLAGLGSLVGLYVLVAIAGLRLRRLTGDKGLLRRRAAAAAARRRLREAKAAQEAGRNREAVELVESALVHLTADVADVPGSGLTGKDVANQLREFGVADELVERVVRFLDACEAGRYGATDHDGHALIGEAESLVEQTIQSLHKQKRLR